MKRYSIQVKERESNSWHEWDEDYDYSLRESKTALKKFRKLLSHREFRLVKWQGTPMKV